MEQLQVKYNPVPILGFSGDICFRNNSSIRQHARNSPIFSSGEKANAVYMVGSGEVKISRYTAEGRELTLDHLTQGQVFGEMEVLLDTLRESQAIARTECVIHTMERDVILSLIAEDPRFGMWLTRMMGIRQARMENQLESLLFKSANGKVAQVLLKLAETHGRENPKGVLIDYPITHQEIGNLIATTRETVSYAFMEFRERGLISTQQRKTIIHDMGELEAVSLT